MTIPWDQLEAALAADDNLGFCLHCGSEVFGVEPDARGYDCEVCGTARVFGAEEILMMGAYT